MPQTADQIVTLAVQIAKTPGMTSQAQAFLNYSLATLAQQYDFPAAAYTFQNFTISPNGGTGTGTPTGQWYNLALPASSILVQNNATYLRTKAVFYSVNGVIFYLDQLPLDKYDRLFQGQGISNYPYWYVVDPTGTPQLSTIQMAFYPPPNLSLNLTIRVQYQPNDLTTAQMTAGNAAAAVPWFPNQDILLDMVVLRLMKVSGDQRYDQVNRSLYGGPNESGSISRYMKMMGDSENYAVQVRRDPLLFRPTIGLAPTKQTGF